MDWMKCEREKSVPLEHVGACIQLHVEHGELFILRRLRALISEKERHCELIGDVSVGGDGMCRVC
jgi:hypothetical protein